MSNLIVTALSILRHRMEMVRVFEDDLVSTQALHNTNHPNQQPKE